MALPSQMPRVSRQASFRAPGRGRRGLPGAILISALIVGGALFAWWKFGQEENGVSRPTQANKVAGVTVLPASDKTTLALGEPKGPIIPSLERKPILNAQSLTGAKPAPVSTAHKQAPSLPTGSAPAEKTAVPAANPANAMPPPGAPSASTLRDPAIQQLIASADGSLAAARKADARLALNRALHDPRASEVDEEMLRQRLTDLNQEMLFSPAITPGDPLADTHSVQPGDRLVKIVNAYDLRIDWRLLQRANKMSDPGRLRIGQKLKIIRGPFHAVVSKMHHRLDLYSDIVDSDGNRVFIRSFPVGLGETNSTPPGKWVVRQASKLVNPPWINPRTGEKFGADDPKNPIGEFWLGVTGTEAATEVLSGYGIHGTIDPASIGHDASMGCVRMLPDDIALVYEMLVEGYSQVEIRP